MSQTTETGRIVNLQQRVEVRRKDNGQIRKVGVLIAEDWISRGIAEAVDAAPKKGRKQE